MSIGKTYKEAFQKAIRSLERGSYGLGHVKDFDQKTKKELLSMLHVPTSQRQFIMYEALRKGATVDELFELTKIKHYFIEQMKELVEEEEALLLSAVLFRIRSVKRMMSGYPPEILLPFSFS